MIIMSPFGQATPSISLAPGAFAPTSSFPSRVTFNPAVLSTLTPSATVPTFTPQATAAVPEAIAPVTTFPVDTGMSRGAKIALGAAVGAVGLGVLIWLLR